MSNTKVSEESLKLAVRDIVGRNPLIAVRALQNELKERGFITAQGNPLDWQYVAKVVRKLNREKAVAVDTQKASERIAITKERYRLMVEVLWRIIDWKDEYVEKYRLMPPKPSDVINAVDTLIKLDIAILKCEMDLGIFDRKLGTMDLNVYRAVPLNPDKAKLIVGAFGAWGITLDVPVQRPNVIEQLPTANAAGDHATASTVG
jgi:hypothetical protein